MTGLKIQVNGRGMIPRGYGLAPRKEPFLATDINLIYLILNTAGLSIKFVNPKTNDLEDLTKKNMKAMWDKYANYDPKTAAVAQPAIPAVEETKPVESQEVKQDVSNPHDVIKEKVGLGYVPADEPSEQPATEETKIPEAESANQATEETKPVESQEVKQDVNKNNNQYNGSKKNKH